MNLKLLFVTLITVGILFENLEACEDKEDKCFFECMLNKGGWLVNGLIDPDKFTNAVKETKNFPEPVLEKIKVATEKCKNHRHFSENKCETATLFAQCSSEEAVKLGLDNTAMAEVIWSTYRQLPLKVLNEEKKRAVSFLLRWG